jgi:hypothetical protein
MLMCCAKWTWVINSIYSVHNRLFLYKALRKKEDSKKIHGNHGPNVIKLFTDVIFGVSAKFCNLIQLTRPSYFPRPLHILIYLLTTNVWHILITV